MAGIKFQKALVASAEYIANGNLNSFVCCNLSSQNATVLHCIATNVPLGWGDCGIVGLLFCLGKRWEIFCKISTVCSRNLWQKNEVDEHNDLLALTLNGSLPCVRWLYWLHRIKHIRNCNRNETKSLKRRNFFSNTTTYGYKANCRPPFRNVLRKKKTRRNFLLKSVSKWAEQTTGF